MPARRDAGATTARSIRGAACGPKRTEVGRRRVPNAVGPSAHRRRVACVARARARPTSRARRSESECESGVVSERVWTSGLARFRVSQCATGDRSLAAENVDTLRQFLCLALFSFSLSSPVFRLCSLATRTRSQYAERSGNIRGNIYAAFANCTRNIREIFARYTPSVRGVTETNLRE